MFYLGVRIVSNCKIIKLDQTENKKEILIYLKL